MKITEAALAKIKQLNTKGEALRLGVSGGGCSGFSYLMEFTPLTEKKMMDREIIYPDLSVFIDAISEVYLNDAELNYLETLEESGFKFSNSSAKSTCGCGKSFNA